MKRVKHLSTPAWLLRGLSSMPGTLKLAKGRLSYTASGSGNFWPRQLRSLETEAGRSGLARQLENEDAAVVFDVPLAEVQHIHFPWFYFSGGVKITLQGVRYRFGFDRPANTMTSSDPSDSLAEVSKARRHGKAWKAALTQDRSNPEAPHAGLG